ncbi:hypothetical protein DWW83_06550 [Bacteroides uniformis]|uniref:Uncharacterized protein n=1 Tax=Bacteroides uniformis TaxID=820 RepID=A0A412SRD0_BACUN|nr:hypothetical protein DWW83_06550 [Bacteroides uniformis]RJW91474.1 hypothetical protein DWZ80_09740 [Bacteroides sp. AF35-22]
MDSCSSASCSRSRYCFLLPDMGCILIIFLNFWCEVSHFLLNYNGYLFLTVEWLRVAGEQNLPYAVLLIT